MFFITVTEVCNFANDTTIYSSLVTYNEANQNLQITYIRWFELVQIK